MASTTNLIDNCIEVYRDPTGPAVRADYRLQQHYGSDQSIPVAIQGQAIGQIAVQEVLT
jgi:hypothetical protein